MYNNCVAAYDEPLALGNKLKTRFFYKQHFYKQLQAETDKKSRKS